MSGDWKPGTVAKATVRGVPNVTVFCTTNSLTGGTEWALDRRIKRCEDDGYGSGFAKSHEVTDVRPLVALDLEALGTTAPGEGESHADYVVRTLRGPVHGNATRRAIADQIEAQTKAPRPAEPEGLGAVVEDENGDRWIRLGGGPAAWVLAHSSPGNRDSIPYVGIRAERILSEGVQS